MGQSLSRVILHIIFSTKDRLPVINQDLDFKLHAYIATVLRDLDSYVFKVGGTSDHIHIACTLPRTMAQSDLVKKAKTSSNAWLQRQGASKFSWQKGYGVFSVGESQIPGLVQYIENQREHHKTKSFQDEYRDFLSKYKVEYSEIYVWD